MNKTKQKILETKRLTESVDYNKGYDIGSDCAETHYKQLLKEQAEQAEDHFASILADIYTKIKEIQILADKEQALETDMALQELLKEFKK